MNLGAITRGIEGMMGRVEDVSCYFLLCSAIRRHLGSPSLWPGIGRGVNKLDGRFEMIPALLRSKRPSWEW